MSLYANPKVVNEISFENDHKDIHEAKLKQNYNLISTSRNYRVMLQTINVGK